jgi:hypothetical protein
MEEKNKILSQISLRDICDFLAETENVPKEPREKPYCFSMMRAHKLLTFESPDKVGVQTGFLYSETTLRKIYEEINPYLRKRKIKKIMGKL